MRGLIFIILMTVSGSAANAQKSFNGISFGATCSFGNKINRFGLQISGYYNYAFAQANSQLAIYYNIRSMALKKRTFEIQWGLGVELGFGREDSVRNEFVGLGENNMEHIYSAGYSYLRYWDWQGTSQSAGIFDLNIIDFRIIGENDLFGGGKGWRDRFRTGGLMIEYQYEKFKFALSTAIWTGDYTGCKTVQDSIYPARFGYRLQEGSEFGDRSVGLFSAQVRYLLPYNQMPRIDLGFDSERVRNFFQNRLIHNMRFFPGKWIKHPQGHIPMLQKDGSQYLFRDGQKIKPTSFYFNLGLNNFPFY
ncbi:hypothetical protein JYT74_02395 [Crocinitomix catalasitica]|nr:hypothetical protein [Crocinitomix catalasitica]